MAQALNPDSLSEYLGYPIQTPPPGVTPNFVNPQSNAYQVYITAAVCIPLMLAFALVRFASRIYVGRKVAIADDIIFVLGLVFCLGFTAMTIACVSGGAFGREAWNVLLGAFTKRQLVLALLVEILGPLAICFVKVSVLILYLQLFSVLRWMRIASIIGIVVITAFHMSLAIAFAAMCSPSGSSQISFLAAFISPKCSRTRSLVVVQGVGNVVTDFFLLILPLPAVWALQVPLKRKIAVSAMFLIGFCACASSIVGLYYRVLYYTAGQNNIRLVVPLWATAIAEEAAGVIICCMPTAASVFKAVKQPVKSWISSASDRALRLTGSSRSTGVHLSNGHLNSRDVAERKTSESSRNPIFWAPNSEDRHTAWVDTEVDSVSLERLGLDSGGIRKKTEFEVSRAV